MSPATFGDFYYGAERPSPPEEQQEPDIRDFLEELLRSTDPDLSSRVEKAVSRWNRPIRDHLRSETGLKVSANGRRSSIPVKVLGAIPEPLLALMLEHWDPSLWTLYFLRGRLENAVEGIDLALKHEDDVRRLLGMNGRSEFQYLSSSKEFLERIVSAYPHEPWTT